jgi:hypothetical protein
VFWSEDRLVMIDQRKLPDVLEFVDCSTVAVRPPRSSARYSPHPHRTTPPC